MKKISWIICAAGKGERFQKIGIRTAKPLIKIHNQTMLELAISSLPIKAGDQLILVTLKSHQVKKLLARQIAKKYQKVEIRWIEIPKVTSGQLATSLIAINKIKGQFNEQQPIAIFNCDTYFKAPRFRQKIFAHDGIIPCARASGASWSFCKSKGSTSKVLKVAEKQRISQWASVGLYSFRSVPYFKKFALMQLKAFARDQSECYIAPLYNRLIENGGQIELLKCSAFKPFGTPEQVRHYWGAISFQKICAEASCF